MRAIDRLLETITWSLLDLRHMVGYLSLGCLVMSKTVSISGVEDNGGANPLSGFSVVKAADMNAAIEIAKSCPFIEMEQGTIEVAEFMQM